jgi:hypothetical protein
MRVLVPLLVLPLAACLQIGTGTGTGTGSGAGSAPPLASAGAPDAGPSGTNCLVDQATQTILCEQIDSCPGVIVDPGAFPGCGFRVGAGSGLDLECLCDTALCPVGVPTTCDQARQLLDAQNELVVCEQQAEGRCVDLLAPDAGGSAACDTACRDECVGAPACLQLCGC